MDFSYFTPFQRDRRNDALFTRRIHPYHQKTVGVQDELRRRFLRCEASLTADGLWCQTFADAHDEIRQLLDFEPPLDASSDLSPNERLELHSALRIVCIRFCKIEEIAKRMSRHLQGLRDHNSDANRNGIMHLIL